MDKRYQVFVSSTYIDLIPERSEVMQALLELECMPAGMELFPAANDTQWAWIKKVIDESDYYIVIVGGRYGSISKESGLSYTEMEYRYALEVGKPVMGFVHEDVSRIQAKFCEQTANGKKKLTNFRNLVASKLCKIYSSPADLGAKVSRSITQMKNHHPAVGWVRADVLNTITSANEVLKIREENDKLKQLIYQLGVQEPDANQSLASGEECFDIKFTYMQSEIFPDTGRYRMIGTEEALIALTWDEMFASIATDLVTNRREYWGPAHPLRQLIYDKYLPILAEKSPTMRMGDIQISESLENTILLQFRALKLMATDDNGKWLLTPFGDNYMAKIVAVPRGQSIPS